MNLKKKEERGKVFHCEPQHRYYSHFVITTDQDFMALLPYVQIRGAIENGRNYSTNFCNSS